MSLLLSQASSTIMVMILDNFKKTLKAAHCMKSVRIRTPPNAGKYGPEKLRLWTHITQCGKE